MSKRKNRNTKGKIIAAAWTLFYKQGYEETTIEEIVEESGTSRGSFYHYFDGKDALLSSLSYIFDEKYEELSQNMDSSLSSLEKLLFLNQQLFLMIENTISVDLLSRLFSSQLITRGNRHLLDQNRSYYKLIREIVSKGQADGELCENIAINEIVKSYAVLERGLMYDWCLCNGDYSLSQYSRAVLPGFLNQYRK